MSCKWELGGEVGKFSWKTCLDGIESHNQAHNVAGHGWNKCVLKVEIKGSMYTWAYENCPQQVLAIQRHNLTKVDELGELEYEKWQRRTHDKLKEEEKYVND